MTSDEDGVAEAPSRALKVPLWLGLPLLGVLWIVVGAWRIHGYGNHDWIGSFVFSTVLGLGLAAYLGLWVLIGRWRIRADRRRRAERPWLDQQGRRRPRQRRGAGTESAERATPEH